MEWYLKIYLISLCFNCYAIQCFLLISKFRNSQLHLSLGCLFIMYNKGFLIVLCFLLPSIPCLSPSLIIIDFSLTLIQTISPLQPKDLHSTLLYFSLNIPFSELILVMCPLLLTPQPNGLNPSFYPSVLRIPPSNLQYQ